MIYSRYYLNQQQDSVKVPTPILVVVLVLMIFILSRFFQTNSLPSRAVKKAVRQIKIVNLLSNQVSVYWQTDVKEKGWLILGEKEGDLNQTFSDDRDTGEKKGQYLNHYVLMKDLQPGKKYYFKIVSQDQIVSQTDEKPFSFQTPTTVSQTTGLKPAYGKIINSNGLPLINAAVVLTFKNSYSLFAITKLTGEWLIPLNGVVDIQSGKIRPIEKSESGLIEIISEDGLKTNVETSADNLGPLPQTLIIGNDYKFGQKDNVLSATSQSKTGQIEILFPKENSVIPAQSPLIKGLAIPNSEVFITINSPVIYSFRAVTDKEGLWKLSLNEKLPAGSHTITLTTKEANGQNIKIIRKFIIAKSGEQVLGSATAEASPTVIVPTLTETVQASVTTPPRPTSGTNIIPIAIASGSLIIIGLGILLAF